MKKLEKKTLDELAKIMPVITEKEQSCIMGGVKFYNESGVYLGTIGSSDELRFVDGNTTFGDITNQVGNTMAGGPVKTLEKRQEAAALNIGSSWSNTSEKSRRSFVTTVVNESQLLNSLKGLQFEDDWDSGTVAAAIFTNKKTGEKTLAISSKQAFFGTYSNAFSMLVHESYHARSGSGSQSSSGASGVELRPDESGAYEYQVNNANYSQTTEAFRLELARGAITNWDWNPNMSSLNERRRAAAILFGVNESLIGF